MKKAYIGYDLGDGETITDFVVLDGVPSRQAPKTVFVSMTMPDCNTPGQAIPTAFGYNEEGALVFTSSILADPECVKNIRANFKRRPTDLIGPVSPERREEMLNTLSKDPDARFPELETRELQDFQEAVVAYTDGIFKDPKYSETVRGATLGCSEIIITAGHPTRWDDLDVAIYKSILGRSCLGSGAYLGLKMTLMMAAESRAAYLYIKDSANASLPKGTCALLIDVGSSTIDLTAMSADSRNHQYNSGNNYLGVRSIDYMIRDWYLGKLREDEDDWMDFQTLIESNPTADKALTLSCRMAKEAVYSIAAMKSRISFADFTTMKITQETVNDLIKTMPIGPVLDNYIGIPQAQVQAMGKKTWAQLFKEFMRDQKAQMTAQKLTVGRIILTGSASKMPIVGEIVREVYPELSGQGVISDMNPSRSISMGLALVGTSEETTRELEDKLNAILEKDVPEIIDQDIPELFSSLSGVISKVVRRIILRCAADWRKGVYDTLDDMTAAIERECSKEKLNVLLNKDTKYQEALRHWMVDVVSQDIAKRLQALCNEFGMENISLNDLNVMKVGSVNVGTISFNPVEDVMSIVSNVVSLLAGIVTAVILPTVLGIVIGIIGIISLDLALLLLSLLMLIPGWGWALIIAIAGYAAWKLVKEGAAGAKEAVAKKIQSAKLPTRARKLLTDQKIANKLDEANLDQKVLDSLDTPECRQKVAESLTDNLNRQIVKRMENIKYFIQNK